MSTPGDRLLALLMFVYRRLLTRNRSKLVKVVPQQKSDSSEYTPQRGHAVKTWIPLALVFGTLSLGTSGFCQENAPAEPSPATAPALPSDPPTTSTRIEGALESGEETIEKLARDVDQDERAKEMSAGILTPIYKVAEFLAFPAFHWVAFAAMVTGVISFALQLVIGKLVVLTRMHLSLTEILSDALGLIISLVGLVLTTQAAAENSTFTQSPAAVLSATALGVLLGLFFYWWGQSQELRAARASRVVVK